MADEHSKEMLAFIFASRTFAYKRFAKSLSRSVSVFSSFMREVLNPFVKADQSAQYVDDMGIAASNAYGPHPEHSGSIQVHPPSRIETDN